MTLLQVTGGGKQTPDLQIWSPNHSATPPYGLLINEISGLCNGPCFFKVLLTITYVTRWELLYDIYHDLKEF